MGAISDIYEQIKAEKPIAIVLTGDFNARSPLFWENDTDTREGRLFNDFILSNNVEELINEPTHIRDDGTQSCIDLICTDQPFMFTETGVLPSLDTHSKHQIIHGNLNFSVPCPPPYKRKIWDYKLADKNKICQDISDVDWESLFFNKSVHVMSKVFTETFLNIISKHIPNKIITCNDKDAPWITQEVKTAIKRNSRVYRKWVIRGRNPAEREHVRGVQNITNKLIKHAKQNYFQRLGDKLSNPATGQKPFWTSFKRIINKKKYTNIPPLIEGSHFVSKFQQKSNIFNDYFAKQCKLLENTSTLPQMGKRTHLTISAIEITETQIVNIISSLNSKKAHGFDEISISMLQLCAGVVAKPLNIIFQNCLRTGIFPNNWKYANVQPVHKKNNRQLKTNYRPISLLPICGKIFEKIVFDCLYHFLNNNNLISKNQSGFRPADSTINQLLSITTNIYESFESFDETRAVFLDISKAFDKVWHEGLIFKLKCNGISDKVQYGGLNYAVLTLIR